MKDVDRYSNIEICSIYRRGASIITLQQLTGRSKKDLENILMDGGYLELNDERKERILEKYNEGLSDIAIARATGYPQSQVSTFLRKQGLPANGKKFGGMAKEKEEVITDHMEEIKTDQPEVKPVEEPQEDVMENIVNAEVETVKVDEIDMEKLRMVNKTPAEPTKAINWKEVYENFAEKVAHDYNNIHQHRDLAIRTLDILENIWRRL